MAGVKDVQGQNAECIVSQFLAVRAELKNRGGNGDLKNLAAILTTAICSSGDEAKAIGLTDGKLKHLPTHRG